MPFFVMKRFGDEKPYSVDWADYKELTILCGGLLYFCTSLSPPTEFKTKEKAEEAIKKSKKIWPEYKFRIVDVERFKIEEEEKERVRKINKEKRKEQIDRVDRGGEVPF
jgi:hypothetical protein